MQHDYRAWRTAPLIVNATYRRVIRLDGEGRPLYEFASVNAARQLPDGRMAGNLIRMDYPPERVIEGEESFAGWTLVAAPAEVEPDGGEGERLPPEKRIAAEVAFHEKRLAALREQARGTSL